MDSWKQHKLAILLDEAPKPFLLVWFFFKDLIKYIFGLFQISWNGLCKAFNKNVIIASCISAFFTLSLFFLLFFFIQGLGLGFVEIGLLALLSIGLNMASVSWGFSTVASIINAQAQDKDDYWLNHISIGFKSIKCLATYIALSIAILCLIIILSSFGMLPQVGQIMLSILSVPFYFLSLVAIFSMISIKMVCAFFGAYYLSGNYNESLNFTDRTKSLFCMIGKKMADWIGIGIPNALTSFLFIIIPVFLTFISLQLIKFPSEGLYGVRFPDILTLKTYHSNYPSDYDVMIMQREFSDKKNKLEKHQLDFNTAYEKQDFLDSLNSKSWDGSEKWSFDKNDKLILNEKDPWTASISWVVKDNEVTYAKDNVVIWKSGLDGKIQYVGDYDYAFFVWLSGFILVFASAIILSIPLGFFYACHASTYYFLYNANFKINIIKKVLAIGLMYFLAICVLVFFINALAGPGFFRYIF